MWDLLAFHLKNTVSLPTGVTSHMGMAEVEMYTRLFVNGEILREMAYAYHKNTLWGLIWVKVGGCCSCSKCTFGLGIQRRTHKRN